MDLFLRPDGRWIAALLRKGKPMNTERIVGFYVGVAIGFGFGILLAPKSGEKSRSVEIQDQASELPRKSIESVAPHREAVRAAVQIGKKAYSKAIHA